MGLFPLVQSPCPYKGPLSDILEGSVCTLCKREVHDLNAMTQAERIALVSACPDEICVRYKVPANSAIAAAALGMAAIASPAIAQDAAPTTASQPAEAQPTTAQEVAQAAQEEWDNMAIIVGGLREPRNARWHSDRPAKKGRELPVIVEPVENRAAPDSAPRPLTGEGKRV